MHIIYMLIVSVMYNGEPLVMDKTMDFDSLAACKYAAGDFVTYVADPSYAITVQCVPVEVNSS